MIRTPASVVALTRHAAFPLAVLVLVFAVAVLAAERALRGRARYHQKGGRGRGLERVRPGACRGRAGLGRAGRSAAALR